jgi:pimeloyl-ACP methyl ester carboxylesterase
VLLKSARLGWGTGSQALRQVFVAKFMGESTEGQRQAFDERQRVTSTAEVAEKYLRAMFALDVKDLAPRVSCPTLAYHSRGDQLIFFEQGRKLAALVPGAGPARLTVDLRYAATVAVAVSYRSSTTPLPAAS